MRMKIFNHVDSACRESISDSRELNLATERMVFGLYQGTAVKTSYRLFSTGCRRLQGKRPEVPDSIKNERPVNVIPTRLGRDQIGNPEFSRLRIVPELKTYYGGNPLHDATISRLNELVRRYMHLPTRALSQEELNDVKFLSFDEYKNNYIASDKVKAAHHKDVMALLNRLRTIDNQLMPPEVLKTLNEFISDSNQTNTQKKTIKTLDANGIGSGKGGKKSSVANVKIVKGDGQIMVNGKNYVEFFTRDQDRTTINYPLLVIEQIGKLNIFATIIGGGVGSKADALRLALVKTLGSLNPIWKKRLTSAGLKPVDPRKVERKKPGKVKARKSPTWVKR